MTVTEDVVTGNVITENAVATAAADTSAAKIAGTQRSGRLHTVQFTYEVVGCSVRPIRFNAAACIHCNRCVSVCQVDVLLPNPDPSTPTGFGVPIVAYPGECYYCGCCVMSCPQKDKEAISLHHPLMNVAKFVPVKKQPADPVPIASFAAGKVRKMGS